VNTNASAPHFEEIVKAYDAKVYKLCWYLLKNRADAQDCTQDIFIAIFQALPHFKQEASLNTWIYRISTNKCYEYLRRKKRKKRFGIHVQIDQFFSQTIASQQHNPEESALAAEKSLFFWKAVDKLPPQQQIAYTLYNVEDMSYQEIAATLQTSLSAVESLLFRARRKLAEALAEWDNK
jgi:RNA polymerase sigma-70 factor (ECF subfamily)